MKKILSLLIVTFFIAKTTSAQSDKGMRFGIKFAPGLSWMTPENSNKIKKDGISMKMALGLAMEFKITDVASFVTGLDYMTAGGKTNYKGSDTAGYYYKDDAIVEATVSGGNLTNPDPTTASSAPIPANGYKAYLLQTRNYKIGYIHIPLDLKLKTKDISGLTYFGQIGGDVFIRTSAKANDGVQQLDFTTGKWGATETLSKVDIAKQVNLVNFGVNIGGGAEYNLSGSTSLFFSLHYVHSLLNTTKSDSKYLLRDKHDNSQADGSYTDYFPNSLKNRQVVLAVGILF